MSLHKNTRKRPVGRGYAKVPVIMQMEALECGAASLAMILAYYGKWIPLEQVRADCGVSRDGSNAKNLLLAARSYGLTARGFRFEPDALRATATKRRISRKTERFPALSTGISIILWYLTALKGIRFI